MMLQIRDTWNALVASDTEYTGTIKFSGSALTDNPAKFTLVLTGNQNQIGGNTPETSMTGSNATIKLAAKDSKLTIGHATTDSGTVATFKKLEIRKWWYCRYSTDSN